MPVTTTLDATVGGTQSNSYVSLAEADAYFESHFNAAKSDTWFGMSDPQKEAALKSAIPGLEALRFLDQWTERLYWNQRRIFPRTCDYDGSQYVVWPEVKYAQCEQALFLMTVDESVLTSQLMGITSEQVSVGNVRTVTDYSSSSGLMISPMAVSLVRPYLKTSRHMLRG